MSKRFFYGYIIVCVCFILQVVMFGPRGSFGVFIKPLTTEFEWSRALVAGAFSLSSLTQGGSSILMGGLNDRFGPRFVLTLCGILVGTGLMLMYFVESSWQLYLFYVALIGVGMGGLYAPQMSTVARWFVKRRNIMTGVLMAGGGMGGLIGPPLITSLIYSYGWREAFLFAGIGVFVLIILASQFLKRDPSQVGQVPYGEGSEARAKASSGGQGMSLPEALRTGTFWIGTLTFFSFGFCFTTLMVHLVPFSMDKGISPASAAIVLSSMNASMTVGSLIVGLTADKIGSRKIFIACICMLSAIALFLLPVNSPWLLGLFGMIVGFGAGGAAVLESSLVAGIFGMKAHGAILGCIVFAFTIGGALGPFIGGAAFDSTGSYQIVFLICFVLVVAATIMSVFITRKSQRSW
jgi:MFS family permease